MPRNNLAYLVAPLVGSRAPRSMCQERTAAIWDDTEDGANFRVWANQAANNISGHLMKESTAGENWSRIGSKPATQQRKHDEWMEPSPETKTLVDQAGGTRSESSDGGT